MSAGTLQRVHLPEPEAHQTDGETKESSGASAPASQDKYAWHWILRLPLGAQVRSLYEQTVAVANRDLATYFDASKHINDDERRAAREPFLKLIRQINAYDSWAPVFGRFKDAAMYVGVFPAWLVVGIVASVAMDTKTPRAIVATYMFASFMYLLAEFAAHLRDLDHPPATAARRLLGLLLIGASGWLLLSGWSVQGVLASCGAVLLAIGGTLAAAIAALFVLYINRIRVRAAVYLAGIALLVLGTASTRPHWPAWAVHGIRSALWGSLALLVVLGLTMLLCDLAAIVMKGWANRRYAIAELVQTLAWLGMSLEDKDRPQGQRSEFSLTSPTLSDVGGVPQALEYIAGLMERFVPLGLRAWDHGSDRFIATRFRGMAYAVRQLKLQFLLDPVSSAEMAGQVVSKIPPIALGSWNDVAYIEPGEQPALPRRARLLRLLGKFVAGVAPLAVLLTLRSTGLGLPSDIFNQALPIAITWLLVSIIAWIDPRSGERAASFPWGGRGGG